jgi:hypothetical protein
MAGLTLVYASRLPGSEAALIPASAIFAYALAVLLPAWRLALLPDVRRTALSLAAWGALLAALVIVLAPIVNSGLAPLAFAGNVAFAGLIFAAAATSVRLLVRWARVVFDWAKAAAPGHAQAASAYVRLTVGL